MIEPLKERYDEMPLMTLSAWRAMMNLFAKEKDEDMALSSVIGMSVLISGLWAAILAAVAPYAVPLTGLTAVLYHLHHHVGLPFRELLSTNGKFNACFAIT